MISYAQNQEDVVLSRLLRFVPVGRFVDVGAGHPIVHNVTYSLYLAGWRGVNVEPMAREADLLRSMRPEDVTLEVALGAHPGRITLYEAPLENRGATTADPELVQRYVREGQSFREFEVDVTTLGSLLADHDPGEVHLVKIDVEGSEPEVLASADLAVHRPWVLVIEATAPNSPEDRSQSWEPSVLASGYSCVLFDGLNRFYVRHDLVEVADLLSVPANVFDNWRSYELVELESQLADLHESATSQLALAAKHLDQVEARSREAEIYVATVVKRAEVAEEYARSLQIALGIHQPAP